jgi:hypothetical protein
MAAVCLLHGVHGKKTDAIGHIPQVLIPRLGDCLAGRSGRCVRHDLRFLLRLTDWELKGLWRLLRAENKIQSPRTRIRSAVTDNPTVVIWWSLRPCPFKGFWTHGLRYDDEAIVEARRLWRE